MATVDELREKYGDKIADDFLEAVNADGPEWYRKELARLAPFEKKYEEVQGELDGIKRTPKVEEAFKSADVDWDALRPLEKKQLLAFSDFENAEAVAAYINENGLPTKQAGGSGGGDPSSVPAAGQVAQQATGAGSSSQINDYDAAVNAATSQEELDQVYARFGKEKATT